MLSIVTLSTVQLTNISTVLGNDNSQLLANQISSTESGPYSFGGLITLLSNSTLKLNQLISECTLIYKTNYILNTGALIGSSTSNTNNILIQNLCFKYNIQSTQVFKAYGLIGYSAGNISLQSSSIQLRVTGLAFQFFGIIGQVYSTSQFTQFVNININLTQFLITAGSSYGDTGALIGNIRTTLCQIINVTAITKNENVTNNVSSGGLIGYCGSNSLQLVNSTVQDSILQAINYCGGFFGSSDNTNYNITHSSLKSVKIQAQNGAGAIIGSIAVNNIGSATLYILSSFYNNISVNSNLLTNCLNVINAWSITQC
ncbi:Hypothetical_protein [Hexamita inflata]|uniref:Hypothetical_protein n=1 Tax=Hexamita inflata TaxID=28002 RepID=A0AA86PFZ1_9EUKA|nr:Hypothetical protein HINF_LOCUS25558 [Hexamita inflata]